jgi:hypothetical protein
VRNEIRGLSGKCLDAEDGKTNNGNRVQIWDCTGVAAQRWTIFR